MNFPIIVVAFISIHSMKQEVVLNYIGQHVRIEPDVLAKGCLLQSFIRFECFELSEKVANGIKNYIMVLRTIIGLRAESIT